MMAPPDCWCPLYGESWIHPWQNIRWYRNSAQPAKPVVILRLLKIVAGCESQRRSLVACANVIQVDPRWITWQRHEVHWRIQAGARNPRPSRSNFFHFYAVSASILSNNSFFALNWGVGTRTTTPSPPHPYGKSWIRHWRDTHSYNENRIKFKLIDTNWHFQLLTG